MSSEVLNACVYTTILFSINFHIHDTLYIHRLDVCVGCVSYKYMCCTTNL